MGYESICHDDELEQATKHEHNQSLINQQEHKIQSCNQYYIITIWWNNSRSSRMIPARKICCASVNRRCCAWTRAPRTTCDDREIINQIIVAINLHGVHWKSIQIQIFKDFPQPFASSRIPVLSDHRFLPEFHKFLPNGNYSFSSPTLRNPHLAIPIHFWSILQHTQIWSYTPVLLGTSCYSEGLLFRIYHKACYSKSLN